MSLKWSELARRRHPSFQHQSFLQSQSEKSGAADQQAGDQLAQRKMRKTSFNVGQPVVVLLQLQAQRARSQFRLGWKSAHASPLSHFHISEGKLLKEDSPFPQTKTAPARALTCLHPAKGSFTACRRDNQRSFSTGGNLS